MICSRSGRDERRNTEIMHENDTDNFTAQENERSGANNRFGRSRKKGMSLTPDDVIELGISNVGYENESCEPEIRKESYEEVLESVPEVDICVDESEVEFDKQTPSSTKVTKSRKVSFFDEQPVPHYSTVERNDSTDVHEVRCNPEIDPLEAEVTASPETEKRRKVSLIKNEFPSGKKFTDDTCKPASTGKSDKRKPKTTKDWLKTPAVYKVSILNVCNIFFHVSAFILLLNTVPTSFRLLLLSYK